MRWRLRQRDVLKCESSLRCMAKVGHLLNRLDEFIGDTKKALREMP